MPGPAERHGPVPIPSPGPAPAPCPRGLPAPRWGRPRPVGCRAPVAAVRVCGSPLSPRSVEDVSQSPESPDLEAIASAPIDDLAATGAPTFDSAHFRAVMGHFTTGITIITAME